MLTGQQLFEAFSHSISQLGSAAVDGFFDGRFLQVSATIWLDWQLENGVPAVRQLMIGSRPETPGGLSRNFVHCNPHGTYSVALPRFLLHGGNGHTVFMAAYEASQIPTLPTYAVDVGLGRTVFEAISSYVEDAAAL
eukprot:6132901-Prymnesium_polylepis.1